DDEWKDIQGVDEELQETISMVAYVKGIKILAFHVHHDAYDPLGYAIMSRDYKVSVCLDTGYVDSNMLNAMKNSDIYIIESNHEPRMVEA
ncbi:MBL fold metallo-hydrolase, partial [Staphylococcus sp. SIMBA_130]